MNSTSQVAAAKKALQAKRPDQALKHLHDALESQPNSAQILSQIGICHMMLGQKSEGILNFEEALRLAPTDSKISKNLAQAYLTNGLADAAYRLLKKACEDDNDNYELLRVLALAAAKTGAQEHALRAHEKMDAANQSLPGDILEQAKIYHQSGRAYDALTLLRRSEEKFPSEDALTHLRGQIAVQHAPPWHIPMLAHDDRNKAYEAAINSTVKSGDIVLDIGTGSGILAMIAARAGAAHVYACEGNPLLAKLAEDIIDSNGLGDKITIIAKHSTDLKIGRDMPRKADILVTEIFDNALIGEGALPTIDHAWRELLAPDAHVIPEGATLYAALTSSPHYTRYHKVDEICGFDVSAINMLAHPMSYKDVNFAFDDGEGNRRLTKPFAIHSWDFSAPPEKAFSERITAQGMHDGNADSILMWFELHLGGGIIFSTASPDNYDHWRQVAQVIREPIPCQTGQNVAVQISYDRYFSVSKA